MRAIAAAILFLPCAALAGDGGRADVNVQVEVDGSGAELRTNTSAGELGLAVYPGAVRDETDRENAAVSLGLWGKESGFRLAVIKFRVADAPEKVVAWYQRELAKVGPVTNCADPGARCSDEHLDTGKQVPGEVELRAGPEDDRRIVAVGAEGGRTKLVLLRLRTPRAK